MAFGDLQALCFMYNDLTCLNKKDGIIHLYIYYF